VVCCYYNKTEVNLLRRYCTVLHPFNALFFRTAWLSQYQKGKPSLDLNEARDDGVLGCSGISWTVCKQSAHSSRQVTTTPHHLVFLQVGCSSCLAQATVSKHGSVKATEGIVLHSTVCHCSDATHTRSVVTVEHNTALAKCSHSSQTSLFQHTLCVRWIIRHNWCSHTLCIHNKITDKINASNFVHSAHNYLHILSTVTNAVTFQISLTSHQL